MDQPYFHAHFKEGLIIRDNFVEDHICLKTHLKAFNASFLVNLVRGPLCIRDVHLANVPLHLNQHAYQSGKSTVTLLHKVVYDIEKAFAEKQSCLGVFLDIEGAFDNVPFDAILEAARGHGISPLISNLIHQMLNPSNTHVI